MKVQTTRPNNNISETATATTTTTAATQNPMVMRFKFLTENILKEDTYNGMSIHLTKCEHLNRTDQTDEFMTELYSKIQTWKNEGKRGIWVYIRTSQSFLVPHLTTNSSSDKNFQSFDFHSAESGLLVLTCWLPQDSPSRLPLGATHQVGVGAVILNPQNSLQMLVVQERTGPAAARKLWKMPTGLADPQEDIAVAVQREVLEETGLQAHLDHIICFRQSHGVNGNKSDMFFICLMKLNDTFADEKPINFELQEEELLDIRWMDIQEYMDQEVWRMSPLYREMNLQILNTARGIQDSNSSSTYSTTPVPGYIGKTLDIGWRPGSNTLYVSKI